MELEKVDDKAPCRWIIKSFGTYKTKWYDKLGGQTALKLAEKLDRYGIKIIGKMLNEEELNQ